MQLLSQKQMSLYTKNKPHILSIGNINIPTDTECKHVLVFGASSSNKSVLPVNFLIKLIHIAKNIMISVIILL